MKTNYQDICGGPRCIFDKKAQHHCLAIVIPPHKIQIASQSIFCHITAKLRIKYEKVLDYFWNRPTRFDKHDTIRVFELSYKIIVFFSLGKTITYTEHGFDIVLIPFM